MDWALDPWIAALYATPTVALAPLFIMWVGVDMGSKVAVVFLVADGDYITGQTINVNGGIYM